MTSLTERQPHEELHPRIAAARATSLTATLKAELAMDERATPDDDVLIPEDYAALARQIAHYGFMALGEGVPQGSNHSHQCACGTKLFCTHEPDKCPLGRNWDCPSCLQIEQDAYFSTLDGGR